MRIEIYCPKSIKASEECRLRAVLFNDSYEPVAVSRNGFIGPNVQESPSAGSPRPDSVESTFGGGDQPLTLQPFTFYGRERTFSGLRPGEVKVFARYRSKEGGKELSASEQMHVEQG
jgi:hypothetical protein